MLDKSIIAAVADAAIVEAIGLTEDSSASMLIDLRNRATRCAVSTFDAAIPLSDWIAKTSALVAFHIDEASRE